MSDQKEETLKALEFMKAIKTISDQVGISRESVCGCLNLNRKFKPVFIEAQEKAQAFYKADIVERGAMLGYTVTTPETRKKEQEK